MNSLIFFGTLMLCTGWALSIETVPELNVSKFVGRWFQTYGNRRSWIGEYGPDAKCNVVDYGIYNATTITVKNTNRKATADGRLSTIEGFAYTTSEPGKLIVDFPFFPTPSEANYFIIMLGPESFGEEELYEYAVVTSPNTGALYVMARDVDRFFVYYNAEVRQFLKENGFTEFWSEPIVIYHTQYCEPIPKP